VAAVKTGILTNVWSGPE